MDGLVSMQDTAQEIVSLDDNFPQLVQQWEKRIESIKKIKGIALRTTNPGDWVKQGDKPYLLVSGAEKLRSLFGIICEISEPKIEYDSDGSGHYAYCCTGNFKLGGSYITGIIGARSTKDPFFKKYEYKKNADGSSERIELPISATDKMDVKKAAYTNCLGNGITRVLGIRGITWDDLTAAGFDINTITEIDYSKKSGKKNNSYSQQSYAAKGGSSDGFASASQVKFIADLLVKKGVAEADHVKNINDRNLLGGEITDLTKLSREAASILIKELQK